MKTRITLILAATLFAAVFANAQSHGKRIAEIRETYANRLNMMNDKPFEDQMFNEACIDVAQNLPGSGMHERHEKYYFTQQQYSYDGSEDSKLYFLTCKITYAMGLHSYYWEFLWDPEKGDPMFALLVREEGDAKQEYRFYFENSKVIKVAPAVKDWPVKDDSMSLHPQTIEKPADVLKLMDSYQANFKRLVYHD